MTHAYIPPRRWHKRRQYRSWHQAVRAMDGRASRAMVMECALVVVIADLLLLVEVCNGVCRAYGCNSLAPLKAFLREAVEYQVCRALHNSSLFEWQLLSKLGLGDAAACLA